MVLPSNYHRGYAQPLKDAEREADLRKRAEREAVHLFDNFLRDRADKKGRHDGTK